MAASDPMVALVAFASEASPVMVNGRRHAYIAGPMRGKPEHNFPAFKEAADFLRSIGWEITSPHELDQEEGYKPEEPVTDEMYAHFLSRDIAILADPAITAIILLPGWQASPGANTEVAFARAVGMEVLSYPSLRPVNDEERIVSSTGGEKGRKPERWDLMPFAALDELARVYGFGAQKYDDHNYLLGYPYSLSSGAMLRHISAWMRGEDRDPESDLHHLAHASWHCQALQMFQRYELGEDDRWAPREETT